MSEDEFGKTHARLCVYAVRNTVAVVPYGKHVTLKSYVDTCRLFRVERVLVDGIDEHFVKDFYKSRGHRNARPLKIDPRFSGFTGQ